MKFSTVFLYSFSLLLTSVAQNPNKSTLCSYRQTVDLTNQQRFDNGSYLYQDVLVPPDKQTFIDYDFLFRHEKVSVPRHLRGCVCDNPKSCIKLCCDKHEFFNIKSQKCEQLSENIKVPWDVTIRLKSLADQVVNIFQQFIYQVAVPCREPDLLLQVMDKWDLLENGNLFIHTNNVSLNTLQYCLTPYEFEDLNENSLIPLRCYGPLPQKWAVILNTYGAAMAVIFLIPTIVVYLALKELRETLRGQILICYLITMTITYGIISYMSITRIRFEFMTCRILGYTCYFFITASYFWLSISCYNLWKRFNVKNVERYLRHHRKIFLQYSLLAWGAAAIFTAVTLGAELSNISDIYKPGIGISVCFLNTQKWSAAIYFFGPILVLLIFNLMVFVHLIVYIYKVRRNSAEPSQEKELLQKNAKIMLRLFLVMDIFWSFDVISYFVPQTTDWQWIFILSDFLNAIRGLVIFIFFVLNGYVLNLLKNSFRFTSSIPNEPLHTSVSSNLQASTNV